MTTFGGMVLCGGRSTRMGQPKAWLPFAGECMLQRIVRRLAGVVRPVIVVAAADQALPELPDDVAIVRDEREGRGPLQGLAAGLAALEGHVEAAFVSSCDAPHLQPGFVRRMLALLGQHGCCVPRVGGRLHPLAAVYRLEVLPTVHALLDDDLLRPVFLFDKVPTRFVDEAELADVDADLVSLRNVNTMEDYHAALELAN